MLPGFRSVPRNDAAALREAVGERTAAVLIEPIQGEAGVYPTSDEALLAARQACDEAGALLILDEIQTGMGRTGSLWAYEQTPVRPDVLTSAKALGGGMPIGACITGPAAADVLEPGDHGSTFAGGPVATAAALAVLDIVDDPALLRRVRELGARLREGLEALDGVARGPRPRPDGRRRPRGRASTPRRSAPTCSSAAWSSTCPRRTRCGCCRRWWSSPAQIERARWTDRRIAPRLVGPDERKDRLSSDAAPGAEHVRAAGGDRRGGRARRGER